ncbi:hypothetical protein BGZ68_000071 [Mortierella alpina]|nr:hypothetical protein BGZ68_000071 [Mortierella alpina]
MSFSHWLLCLVGTLSVFGLPVFVQPSPVPTAHTPLVNPGIFSIPLTRLIPRHASSHHYTYVRSSTPAGSLLIEKRSTEARAVAVPVKAVGRVGYAGNILIGNPPQSITVLFDTGSDLALVISDECQGDECADLTHFSCSSSSTCVDLGGGGGDGSNRRGTRPMTLDSSTLGPEDVAGKVAGGSNSNAGVESGRKADHGLKIKDSTKSEHTESVVKTHSVDHEAVASQAKMTAPFTTRLVGPGVSKIEDSLQRTTNYGSMSGHQSARTQVYSPWSRLYNQSFVDGSWGAGTFVQDRIQVDASPTTDTSSLSSQETGSAHSATVTFLNVVQDNLGLVRGYEGQVSGLLGLTRSSATGRKTFLQELVSQGSLAMPVMSMRLDLQGGSFMMGGIDPTQYSGELIYGPVTDPVTWQLSLQGLATRARPSPGTDSSSSAMPMSHLLPQSNIFQDASLIIDSGTSSILIPTAASEAIHGELSGTYDPIHRAWFLPCEGPDLVWWISSGQYGVIQPYESLIYPLEDGRCQSLIFENQDADYWILGDTWLRGLYLVYDMAENGRIGIATAIPSNTGAGDGMGAVGENEWTRILAYQETSTGGRSHGGFRWTLAVVSMAGVMFFQTTAGLFP